MNPLDAIEAALDTAAITLEAVRIGARVRLVEVHDSDDVVVHYDYLGTSTETSEHLGDLVADAMKALGYEFSGAAGPTGGGIIGGVTYSGGEYTRYQPVERAAEVVDSSVYFERIKTGAEFHVVLYNDERNGNQPLEDYLTEAARDAGWVLVEDEDGDLVLHCIEA